MRDADQRHRLPQPDRLALDVALDFGRAGGICKNRVIVLLSLLSFYCTSHSHGFQMAKIDPFPGLRQGFLGLRPRPPPWRNPRKGRDQILNRNLAEP